MIARTPLQVAKRALILGAMSFRASLEVTDHPRTLELSERLLPWLHALGIDHELDPHEREQLATKLGGLSKSQTRDVNWAGEAAMFFCWTLKLAPCRALTELSDQSELPVLLHILRPEARQILNSASLVDAKEIEGVCKRLVLTRSALQQARVDLQARDIVRRFHLRRLAEAGLDVTREDEDRVRDTVAAMSPEEKERATGPCVVLERAALWLFRQDARYFEVDE